MQKKNYYQITEEQSKELYEIYVFKAILISPCCPTKISLKKLIIPIQITGPTSTPPIGGINFLVKLRIQLDGIEINNHKPLLKSIFGYQVRINLIKKTRVKYDRATPKKTFKTWRKLKSKEITII